MDDHNAVFENMLAAYRSADDPDRFLREFLLRLDDATSNAVVATERKLDRLDAAKARLDAAREIPRPETSKDGDAVEEQEEPEEPVEASPKPKPKPKPRKTKAKAPAAASDAA